MDKFLGKLFNSVAGFSNPMEAWQPLNSDELLVLTCAVINALSKDKEIVTVCEKIVSTRKRRASLEKELNKLNHPSTLYETRDVSDVACPNCPDCSCRRSPTTEKE